MPLLRFRLTGRQFDVDAVVTAIHGIDGIEHVEEVADLMPHLDDDDSSSAGLPDDMGGTDVHAIEVDAPNAETADRVREQVDRAAETYGLAVEFVEEF